MKKLLNQQKNNLSKINYGINIIYLLFFLISVFIGIKLSDFITLSNEYGINAVFKEKIKIVDYKPYLVTSKGDVLKDRTFPNFFLLIVITFSQFFVYRFLFHFFRNKLKNMKNNKLNNKDNAQYKKPA